MKIRAIITTVAGVELVDVFEDAPPGTTPESHAADVADRSRGEATLLLGERIYFTRHVVSIRFFDAVNPPDDVRWAFPNLGDPAPPR